MPEGLTRAAELTLAQVMLPEDANPRGNVHGGTLMKLADSAGGVCASRHTRQRVVTAVVGSMTFEDPVYVGNLVVLHAVVTWTGRTSIETEVTIHAEDALTGTVRHIRQPISCMSQPMNTASQLRYDRST